MLDFYTWTRDSALTFKYLISAYIAGNTSLRDLIQSYILAQGKLQQLDNPSGGFTTGGLGEPKFYPNLTAFTGDWGRPQRDGPALRASTLIAYANHLLSLNQTNVVKAVIWPVVQNDLSYVSQYWNQTGFDLWEEVNGSSIFTTAMQQRALVEGSDLAKALGGSCPHCDSQAPEIACFMESYWWGNRSISNQNVQSQGYTRSGYDCASILTSIHLFDAKAKCDVDGYQPCQGKALANHKAVVDSMRKSYRIQDDLQPIFEGKAAPVGRYPEVSICTTYGRIGTEFLARTSIMMGTPGISAPRRPRSSSTKLSTNGTPPARLWLTKPVNPSLKTSFQISRQEPSRNLPRPSHRSQTR